MSNDQLKPIIDEILTDYFNRATRLSYSTKVQEKMINQNSALCNACASVIKFADDQDELAEYTREKIVEINKGEAQEVGFRRR